ncbi:hypothetical protein [Paludisphaera mucosa]|uniref:Uncharacterized protein n=1 Tax=Paludisphaera mucosa TaxID=3030827 RepID=A0ABT6FHH5_9BACT|nr:hypothetical protein [Paludisphaera mucosa]MDG3006995.1 hypothetical protein [Paludisphaera mucosa]
MTEPPPNRPAAPALRSAYVLLGAMTLVSFAGPFGLALLLAGGERRGWPPDRPVEWAGAAVLLVLFSACLVACLTVRLWLLRPTRDEDRPKSES